jgi:gliding motility-associated protein GldE
LHYFSAFIHTTILSIITEQTTIVLIVLLLFLLILSFIISGAEIAFFSLTYKDINLLKTKPQPNYRRIVELLNEPKKLLATFLIANSFINIGIIILSNILLDSLFNFNNYFHWVGFLIKVALVAFVLLMFSEILPKTTAANNNIRFAKDTGAIVDFFHIILGKLSNFLTKYSDLIEKKLSHSAGAGISNEDWYHAIDITETGTTENEKKILKGILKFGDITVKQIMKTRLDVHGIDYNTSFNDLLKQLSELHYSRLPVYKEDLDEVVGIIHTKDLLPYLNNDLNFNWHGLIRQPYFVHEQKMIEDLLREFQNKHIHFAVVVDEFGGTSGIVTLEDVLEEVIGDIKDEFDEDELGYKKLDENNYIFDGRTMINDVCKIMELPVNTFDSIKGESDSLAGLILELAGEIPPNGKKIVSGDFEFTVIDVEKTRINKIKITIKLRQSEE